MIESAETRGVGCSTAGAADGLVGMSGMHWIKNTLLSLRVDEVTARGSRQVALQKHGQLSTVLLPTSKHILCFTHNGTDHAPFIEKLVTFFLIKRLMCAYCLTSRCTMPQYQGNAKHRVQNAVFSL